MPFSEPWPKAGGMRSGCVWRRPTWERRTGGTDGSSWATATSHEWTHDAREVDHGVQLANQVERWPLWQTPSVSDTTGGHLTRGGDRSGEALLPGQVRNWPTPFGLQAGNGPSGNEFAKMVERWPTATKEDDSGRWPASSQIGLDLAAANWVASLPAPQTSLPGIASYLATCHGHRRYLNPRFVESLMGFATDWTRPCGIGDTVSVDSETPSSPSKAPPPSPNSGGA